MPKDLKKSKKGVGYEVLGSVPFEIKESGVEESSGKKWCLIGGTALKVCTSLNGITYTQENISENDKKQGKFFVEHDLQVKNLVGTVKFFKENEELKYEARIRNTVDHPDIVEKAVDKLLDVSIDARYEDLITEEEDTKVKGLDIRALVATGIGGVPGNSLDFAIMESYGNKTESKKENSMDEVKSMAEESKITADAKLVAERDDARKIAEESAKKLAVVEEKLAKIKEAERKKLIASVLESNGKRKGSLTEEKLLKMSDETLGILKEQEDEAAAKAAEETKKEEESDGKAEVPDEEESPIPQSDGIGEADFFKHIVVEKDGTTYLKSQSWKSFNDGIKSEVRGFVGGIPDNPNRAKYGR